MKMQLSEKLYERAKWALFLASINLVAAVSMAIIGVLLLPVDGFYGWLSLASAGIAMGLSLGNSARAMRLTRYAMAEEESEWRRAIQPFRL